MSTSYRGRPPRPFARQLSRHVTLAGMSGPVESRALSDVQQGMRFEQLAGTEPELNIVQATFTVETTIDVPARRDSEFTRRQRGAFLEADRFRQFDLGCVPSFRVTLLLLAGKKTLSILAHHHISLDGRSLRMVLEEVFRCYETIRSGRAPLQNR